MKIDHQKYSHISFDLWLTLIKSNPEFKTKRDILLRDFFNVNHSIEEVSKVVRYYDILCNQINEHTGLNIDTNEIYYLILNKLNVEIGDVDSISLARFYDETENLFFKYKPVLLFPRIQELFDEIRLENKTMNILSNTGFIKGRTLKK